MIEMLKEVDGNIRELVKILNGFPDVDTFSSCGGHKDNSEFQCSEGKFYVGFDIGNSKSRSNLPSKKGWGSLGKILQSVSDYEAGSDFGDLNIIACNLSEERDDPNGFCNSFELHGSDIDIPSLVKILEMRLRR